MTDTTIDKDVMERAEAIARQWASPETRSVWSNVIASSIQAARNEEREACAKIADGCSSAYENADAPGESFFQGAEWAAARIGTAIRTRGE